MAQQKEELRRGGGQHFVQNKPPSYGLSQLITFFLSVTLMCSLLGIIARNSFLDKSFTTKELVTTENVSALHKGLSASVNSFITSDAGFRLDGDLVTKKQVKEDLNEAINNVYAGQNELLAPSKIVGQITDNFMTQARKQGVSTQSEDFLSYKSNFVAQVETAINNQINNSLLQKGSSFLQKAQHIFHNMYLWGIILSLILAVLLLIQTRSFFRFSHYTGIAFLLVGLLVWLLVELTKVSGMVDNFAASVGMYRSFIVDYGTAVISTFDHYARLYGYIGIFLLGVALVGRLILKNNF